MCFIIDKLRSNVRIHTDQFRSFVLLFYKAILFLCTDPVEQSLGVKTKSLSYPVGPCCLPQSSPPTTCNGGRMRGTLKLAVLSKCSPSSDFWCIIFLLTSPDAFPQLLVVLFPSVDIWLNSTRWVEASSTSSFLHWAVPSFSVLDGWWLEV